MAVLQKRKADYDSFGGSNMIHQSSVLDYESNDAKKVRLVSDVSQIMPPSRVLHLRRLPTDVTESEVATLAIPFGTLNNMILTKKTGQALVELASQDAATAMVQYYSGICPPSIRGTSQVIVQFSKHNMLTTSEISQHVSDAIIKANKQSVANAMDVSHNGIQKSIIRVQVERLPPHIQLNYMMFYKLFRQYGEIFRIVVFKSAQMPQALIEFSNPLSAHVAILQTNSLPLFPNGGSGSGVMRVDFSRQDQLEVRRENDNCRDFIVNPLTEQELANITSANFINGTNSATISAAQYLSATTGAGTLFDAKGNIDSAALASIAGHVIQPLLSAAAGRGSQVDTAVLQQQLVALQQLAPQAGVAGIAGIDVPHHFNTSGMQHQDISGSHGSSPVIIVSGLDVTRVTPDTLFILFGVYGDVQRVKILFNKKDTALVQFSDASQAVSAVSNVNGVTLYGNTIRCNFSKHFNIKMPQSMSTDNVDGDGTGDSTGDSGTRDYSNHRLHRFKRANSRNHQNIYPPTCVLHISNLPDTTSESDLIQIFQSVTGSVVVKCKMMVNEKRMALMQFESIDNAIAALIDMHDYQLTENNRIRVSFSKSVIRD